MVNRVVNTEWNHVNCGNTNENEYMTIAVASQFKQLRNSPKKGFSGLHRDSNRGLCVGAALLYQLNYEDPCSGSRPIYWVHQPVQGMKHRMKLYELRELSGKCFSCAKCMIKYKIRCMIKYKVRFKMKIKLLIVVENLDKTTVDLTYYRCLAGVNWNDKIRK